MPEQATEELDRDPPRPQRDWRRDDPAPGPVGVEIPFESRRVPMRRRVILKFQHVSGFVGEYAANISLKGMFIRAWVPEPPGTVFLFEIWVSDSRRLIHGVAEVVWVRDADEGADRPAGMGVRFLKLDEESRATVERIVQAHLKSGGEPFRLEETAEREGPIGLLVEPELIGETEPMAETRDPGEATSPAPAEPAWVMPAAPRVMVRRRRWPALLALLAGVLAAGVLLAFYLLRGI